MSVVTGPSKLSNSDSDKYSNIVQSVIDTKKMAPMSVYTINDLKDIAKHFNIPQTYKADNGTRKTYKKEEFYKKIKSELIV